MASPAATALPNDVSRATVSVRSTSPAFSARRRMSGVVSTLPVSTTTTRSGRRVERASAVSTAGSHRVPSCVTSTAVTRCSRGGRSSTTSPRSSRSKLRSRSSDASVSGSAGGAGRGSSRSVTSCSSPGRVAAMPRTWAPSRRSSPRVSSWVLVDPSRAAVEEAAEPPRRVSTSRVSTLSTAGTSVAMARRTLCDEDGCSVARRPVRSGGVPHPSSDCDEPVAEARTGPLVRQTGWEGGQERVTPLVRRRPS